MILDASKPTRTGTRRTYLDPDTAGSLWDAVLGSDWPARDCGLQYLDGLDSDAPATVTPIWQSRLGNGPYQRPRISRVEIADRVLYLAERGYGEGYVLALCATEDEAREVLPIESGWERVES